MLWSYWTRSGKDRPRGSLCGVGKRLRPTRGIPVREEFRAATGCYETAPATLQSVNDVKDNEQILDIGDASAQQFAELLKTAKILHLTVPVASIVFPKLRNGTYPVTHVQPIKLSFSTSPVQTTPE